MDPHTHSPRWLRSVGLTACAAVSLVVNAYAGTPAAPPPGIQAASWKERTIAPVTNPIFFEDAQIRTEIRPIFVHHRIDDAFLGGGDAQLYALQLRYALTDRLALIATQDGYMDVNNDALANPDGWMDLAAGLKYALIDNEAANFILTTGLTFHIPTGSRAVFQRRGNGEFNPFVSFQKGWGDLHLSGNLGWRLPVDSNAQSSILHYSAMVDYFVNDRFVPFISFNAFSVTNAGNNIGLLSEGYDVFNFGATGSQGVTQGMIGLGFRSRLFGKTWLGVAYEKAVITPKALSDERLTLDLSIQF